MTPEAFLVALDSGLHEDNLRKLVEGLGDQVRSGGPLGRRTSLYVLQSVLADVLGLLSDTPVESSRLDEIEKRLVPRIRAVITSVKSSNVTDQALATDDLVVAFLGLPRS